MYIMDLFTEGQKITLFFQKDTNLVEMTCSLEKLYEDRIELQLPQYFMRYVNYLQVGMSITAKAFTKLGTVDFNSIIITSPLEDCFSIELDYNSLRLNSNNDDVNIKAIETVEIVKDDNEFKFKTFEISTEYIKFTSDTKFVLDEEFNGTIILPKNYGIIDFKAVISDIDPIYNNEYTAKYITMTEQCRQDLLYYMYIYSKDID